MSSGCRHASDSTWEKSKRRTERNLETVEKEMRVYEISWVEAEEESERQATVVGSGHGLMCPRARKGLSE